MRLRKKINLILREVHERVRKEFMRYVDEFGVSEAAETLGISVAKLVEITNLPIDETLAAEILSEGVINETLTTKYNDFKIFVDYHAGVFYWEGEISTGYYDDNIIEKVTVMATPFWDGNDVTPVELDSFSIMDENGVIINERLGEGDFYRVLESKSSFKSVEELIDWYENFYLPEVHSIIMNKFLPEVHKSLED